MKARVAVIVLLAALGCAGERAIVVRDARLRMGTLLAVTAWGPDSVALERALGQAFDSVRLLDSLLSTYSERSEISRVNRDGQGTGVSDHFAVVLARSLDVARASAGAFDPTLHDWRGVQFGGAARTVRLEQGLRLDFGGIAKGYALDRAALPLARVADSALLDFGGQLLYVERGKAVQGGRSRWVGIVDPDDATRVTALLDVSAGSVSTSSQAQRPGHIVDPRTGKVAARARSVTVVAPTGVAADAWSTALFVLGCDSALILAPRVGVEVLCVDRSGAVRWSRGLDGGVTLVTASPAGSRGPSPAPARDRGSAGRSSRSRSRAPGS